MKLIDLLESTQDRVAAGAVNQDIVWKDLQKKFGDRVKLVSQASAGSTKDDIVVEIDGKRVQIEVKGRQNQARWSIVYDVRMSQKPGDHDDPKVKQLDQAVKIMTHGEFTTLRDYVNAKRRKKATKDHGFSGQINSPSSGKVTLVAPDDAIKNLIPLVRAHWTSKGEQYVATVIGNKVKYYRLTDLNIIPGAMSTLPITAAQIETVGSGRFNKTHKLQMTRVGLKVQM